MLPMALWCTSAAAFRRLPSMALPITIVLSTALRDLVNDAPGSGLMYRSESQSMSFRNG